MQPQPHRRICEPECNIERSAYINGWTPRWLVRPATDAAEATPEHAIMRAKLPIASQNSPKTIYALRGAAQSGRGGRLAK